MTAATVDSDVFPVRDGWRVRRADGTCRVVLPRLDTGWAVFDGSSTTTTRTPALGYAGSWKQDEQAAIDWARVIR